MIMITTTLKKWGNSMGLVLPSKIVKKLSLNKNDKIVINIMEKKRIDGFGIFKGSPPFEREEDLLEPRSGD